MKYITKDSFLKTSKRFGGLLPIVIDMETSGINPDSNAILEIASIVLHLNDRLELQCGNFFSCHIKPSRCSILDPSSMCINAIEIKNPFRLALSEKEAINRLFRFVYVNLKNFECKKAVLVGHNANFDLSFLEAACKRHKIDSPFHAFTAIDTATIGAFFYGKTVLANVVNASNIRFNPKLAHSAIYDARITANLFCSIVNSQERYLQNLF